MSHHGSAASSNANEPLEPRRLELSLNPEDGSLRTASLYHVLLAATDDLYSDLYSMAHGELDVTTAAAADDTDEQQPTHETKKEKMSNLSFAQRRHELAWRLARHGKSLQHVAALTAASATTGLSNAVAVSSKALQHTRTAWVQADEAQDALYFFHAQLFPGRAAPHDVYGACDLQLAGKWYDMCRDVRLTMDPYEVSKENLMSKQELDDEWQMAVRRKLLTGEVGWMRRAKQKAPWKVSLRGGVVKLTQGSSIEAMLTVVPSESPEWTLLSLQVTVQAKTGEFNHQLEPSNRQRYDLHRLAALSMSRAEARKRLEQKEAKKEASDDAMDIDQSTPETKQIDIPARPLHALFQVAQRFSLSWQLEVLSAQAQGLRRGVWAAGTSNPIHITPVKFFPENDDVLGVVSISFWKVDDAYGPPTVSNLSSNESSDDETQFDSKYLPPTTSQLVLCIQAVAHVGIRIALSGSDGIQTAMKEQPRLKSTVQDLLEAASNPFSLSASDALLAATRLCAERKCHAVVQALLQDATILPDWIVVTVEQESIAVGARVQYYTGKDSQEQQVNPQPFPILFRLLCDGRTGSFVPTFPRTLHVLRHLAANEHGEAIAIRMASLPANRRRTSAIANATSCRCVRDAMDGLIRCMNVLGHRAAVGGAWDDVDTVQSPKLRQRSIRSACVDVQTALVKCCALSVLYGLAPLALATAVGLDAVPDM